MLIIDSKKNNEKTQKREYFSKINSVVPGVFWVYQYITVLKFVKCLQIFLFLKIYYSVLEVRVLGVTQLDIFANVTNVWPLNGLKLKPIQLLKAVVSSLTSSQTHFYCHGEHKTNPQFPLSPIHWWPN